MLNPEGTQAECAAPLMGNVPVMDEGADVVYSTISLRFEEVDFVTLEQPLGFADCSVHQRYVLMSSPTLYCN